MYQARAGYYRYYLSQYNKLKNISGFLKSIATVAITGIVIIAILLVLDVVTAVETKEILIKVLLVLGIIALGGVSVSFLSGR